MIKAEALTLPTPAVTVLANLCRLVIPCSFVVAHRTGTFPSVRSSNR